MSFVQTLSPLLAVLLVATPFAGAAAQEVAIERSGLYILAEDVEGTTQFYVRLLAREPQVRTPDFVSFDVAGGILAVVARSRYAPDSSRGDVVRPFIKVSDIDAAYAHVRRVSPTSLQSEAVIHEGPFSFFRLSDPEGNIVEFFSLRRASK